MYGQIEREGERERRRRKGEREVQILFKKANSIDVDGQWKVLSFPSFAEGDLVFQANDKWHKYIKNIIYNRQF